MKTAFLSSRHRAVSPARLRNRPRRPIWSAAYRNNVQFLSSQLAAVSLLLGTSAYCAEAFPRSRKPIKPHSGQAQKGLWEHIAGKNSLTTEEMPPWVRRSTRTVEKVSRLCPLPSTNRRRPNPSEPFGPREPFDRSFRREAPTIRAAIANLDGMGRLVPPPIPCALLADLVHPAQRDQGRLGAGQIPAFVGRTCCDGCGPHAFPEYIPSGSAEVPVAALSRANSLFAGHVT